MLNSEKSWLNSKWASGQNLSKDRVQAAKLFQSIDYAKSI